jgi:soluble lytic murein transglycosylase-like protein
VTTSLVSRKSARLFLALLSSAFAAATVPAHADVLEVSRGKSEWIAGGHGSPGEQVSVELAQGSAVPVAAFADPAANAGAVPQAFAAKVHELSARYDLSPALIEALVWQESRWRTGAVSPVGARGLAQLMPGTAHSLGVDPDDPMANLEGGVRYLRQQLDRFGGDLEKALAAYNAGPGRVEQAGGVPRIRETQTYVAAVLARLSNHTRR